MQAERIYICEIRTVPIINITIDACLILKSSIFFTRNNKYFLQYYHQHYVYINSYNTIIYILFWTICYLLRVFTYIHIKKYQSSSGKDITNNLLLYYFPCLQYLNTQTTIGRLWQSIVVIINFSLSFSVISLFIFLTRRWFILITIFKIVFFCFIKNRFIIKIITTLHNLIICLLNKVINLPHARIIQISLTQ